MRKPKTQEQALAGDHSMAGLLAYHDWLLDQGQDLLEIRAVIVLVRWFAECYREPWPAPNEELGGEWRLERLVMAWRNLRTEAMEYSEVRLGIYHASDLCLKVTCRGDWNEAKVLEKMRRGASLAYATLLHRQMIEVIAGEYR